VGLLAERFGYGNRLAVPRLTKICLNMGVGTARETPKKLEEAVRDLTLITGQRAAVTKARKSVSAFKLRRGYDIGCRVTLRGAKMYEFFDRLISVAIPRIRDFRGMNPSAFDGRGNYTFGITEKTIFPEVNPDAAEFAQGMDVTIVTTAKTDEEGRELLRAFGFPFREKK
jgi:large subunit ribosomal protein L5